MRKITDRGSTVRQGKTLLTTLFLILLTATFGITNVIAQDSSLSAPVGQVPQELDGGKEKTEDNFVFSPYSTDLINSPYSLDLITAGTYAFSTLTGVAFEDMSAGTTQLALPFSDDTASALQNIGFEFWYDGVRFTQFGSNGNGIIRLGATTGSSFTNSLGTTTDTPKIAPYWDDLCVGETGTVHYKTIGTAPNRKMIVEWRDMKITRNGTCVAAVGNGTFQLWLFESAGTTPGRIQFVYGALPAPAAADNGYSIGLQSGAATNFASVTSSTDSVDYATANNAQTDAIPAGKSYIFTPNIPTAAPSGLTFTAVAATSQTLNWTDNSTNEFGFVIYRSTDGTNYSFIAQTAADATSFTDTLLNPSTNYFYRVFAVTEGALSSPALSGSQSTGALGNDTCNGAGGNWSSPGTWADGTVPTTSDNVTIGSGCTVSVDITTAVAYNVTINSGGTLQSPTTGAVTTNNLTVSTNVTNNGTLDFSTNGDTSGAILTFGAGGNDVTFSGTGATTDVRAITVAKGAQATVVELTTTNFTVQGVNTDSAGFLTLTSGTFKISGTFTATNRIFTTVGYTIPAAGGIWLNNPNFTVAGQAGSPTVTGLLRLTQGTYNVGTATGNSLGGGTGGQFVIEGGTLNTAGRLQTASAISYTQSGGNVNVCTVGNTATTACFGLTSASNTFNMSGGNITLVTPNGNATPLDYSVSSASTFVANPAGTTLQIGNGSTPAASTFRVTGNIPNLLVSSGQNMNVGSGTAGAAIFFRGATITNNGNIAIQGTGASSRFDFAASGAMTYGGTGTFGTAVLPFAGVGISANSPTGSNATINSPIFINRANLFSGGFVNSNQITFGSGGASTTVVQVGNSTTPTNAGSFDVSPVYNSGTGGHILLHLRTTTLNRTTGFEVNTARNLAQLTVDNDAVGATLAIAGGDLAVTTLILTNGVVTTGTNTLTDNGTPARTNGYVNGNLRRNYTATAAYTYFVGQNGYSPVLANVTALGTNPSGLTVKPVDATLPGLVPATAVSRYWTLTESGDLTADLTFTYIDPDDVNGTEANYKVFKRVMGVTTEVTPNSNNPAANTASVTGVSDFSDWGIGEAIQVASPPTISDIADQTILEDGNTGALAFTVGDAETAPAALTVAGTSSNTTLVPNANIVFGGSGASRTVTVTPAANQSGTATITVTVTDGDMMTASDTFLLTVTAVNDAPTLDAISDVTIPQDSPAQTVNLTGISAGGGETQVLTVTASSSNTALIPNPTVTYTSPNATGSISFTPVAGQSGMATITVTVTDDGGTANGGVNTFSRMFTVNVTPPAAGNVTVNPGNISYATLKEAFDAINAGTHTGAVTVTINNNTTETATASLDASGVGTASYTSVLIRPSGGSKTVEGTITGAIVKLNGADNVTIDGRQGGTGTARDLTIKNNSNVAASAAVWLSSLGDGLGATNNIIRNLELACGPSNANAANTFGIIMSGTAITPTSNGADNDNNQFIFNRVTSARYGIVTRGVTTNNNIAPIVSDNIIGPSTGFGANGISKTGILMQADTDAIVSRNTVQFIGGDFANTTAGTDRVGIGIGTDSAGITTTTTITSGNYTVTRNIIHDVVEERTFSAAGIVLGTTRGGDPTGNLVANNFIYNIRTNGTAGDQTTGININGGNGDFIVFNSISLTGDIDPVGSSVPATQFGNGIRITGANGANNANFTVANNSILMDLSSDTATVHFYAITLNNANYSFGTGFLNNNNYYINPANTQLFTGGLASASGAATTTEFATLANWRTALTPPQDANSIQADPQYVSNTADLHIAAMSPNVNAGVAAGGVSDDIDGQLRVGMPDIGADEPAGTAPLPNDVAAISIVSPATGSTIPTGGTITPQARFRNVGTATQTNVMVRFTITGPGGFNYTDTQTIASIDANQTITVTFAPTPVLTAAGTYTTTAAVITADGNAANDTVMGSFNTIDPISGSVNVGAGQTFTSLTNPGGIFEALNLAGASGNVVVNITSDLTGETGAVALNELPSGATLTIKPSGAARSITGSTASTAGLIKLSGADNVTIDGSLNGGTDRSLTINQTGLGAIIWIATDGTNGSNNDTVKNSILVGAGSSQGVIAGSGATLGGAGTAPQSNNTLQNNAIRAVQNASFISGIAATDQNWTIVDNEAGSTVTAEKLSFRGFILINSTNMTVSRNRIIGVNSTPTSTATMSGIQVSGTISGGQITRNEIRDIKQINPTGFGSNGIYSTATSTTSNLLIANNFVSDVASQGAAGVLATNNGYGIAIAGGGGYNIYYNSVNMNTNQVSASSTTAALNITVAVTTAGSIDLRNNILSNTQTVGTRYAVIDNSTQGAAVFSTINYNDYFAQNVGFLGSARVTLADWQTATGQDANSKAVDPLFVSATDLHLQPTSTLIDMATPLAAVTDDFDGQTRGAMPDIGGDEVGGVVTMPGTLALSAATYSVGEGNGTVTVTVNRTGGTDGAVSVAYTLSGGSATGGAACGGTVDYVNTGGTVNFANGEASKTFTVVICDDAAVEGNETFNVVLGAATGGATVGTPSTAVVTIIDNDVAGPGSIQFSSATYTGREGGAATITVTRTGGTTGNDTVQYATSNGTAIGGMTCAAGIDYISTSGTLTFAPGATSQVFNVTLCPDATFKPAETINLTLSNATGNSTLGMPSTAVLTIIDKARVRNDFDGDGKTDASVFRPSANFFYILQSSNLSFRPVNFGAATDIPVTADYDGDGKTDVAVFRPSNGAWYLLESGTNTLRTEFWGLGTDRVVPGDYDGDGKADVAVWRESNGTWYIKQSSNGVLYAQAFGQTGDRPLVGDFDNDGRTELTVVRAAAGASSPATVYSINTITQAFTATNWGVRSDTFVIGDYDGDGKSDIAVYRSSEGNWYVLKSSTNTLLSVTWGISTDIPIAGDYDGDGKTDFTVWRPSNGTFYSLFQTGGQQGLQWGISTDNPLTNAVNF